MSYGCEDMLLGPLSSCVNAMQGDAPGKFGRLYARYAMWFRLKNRSPADLKVYCHVTACKHYESNTRIATRIATRIKGMAERDTCRVLSKV